MVKRDSYEGMKGTGDRLEMGLRGTRGRHWNWIGMIWVERREGEK